MNRKTKTLYPKLADRKSYALVFAFPTGLVIACVFLTIHAVLIRGLTRTDIVVLGLNGLTFLIVYIGIRNKMGILEDGILIPKAFWRIFVPISDISYVRLNVVNTTGFPMIVREVEVHTLDFRIYIIPEWQIGNLERFHKVLAEDLKDQVEARE